MNKKFLRYFLIGCTLFFVSSEADARLSTKKLTPEDCKKIQEKRKSECLRVINTQKFFYPILQNQDTFVGFCWDEVDSNYDQCLKKGFFPKTDLLSTKLFDPTKMINKKNIKT